MPAQVARFATIAGRRAARLPHQARARIGARGGRAAVLLYHRVAAPDRDAWDLSVPPETFAGHMALISASYRPLSLSDLLAAADAGRVPERTVAVTFDDGYVDNLTAALPVLEREQVPATVYVASGYVDRDRAYWWDEVEHLLLAPSGRPDPSPALMLRGRRQSFDLGDPRARERALVDVIQPELRRSSADQIEQTLTDCRSWAGREAGPGPDGSRCVRSDELAQLAASDLIEVGGHTRRHPSLRALGRAAARDEIQSCRSDLADLLGRPPTAFSYPFGDLRPGYGRLVREAGFTSAVGTQWAIPVTPRADRFQLPRTVVADVSADHLDRELAALVG